MDKGAPLGAMILDYWGYFCGRLDNPPGKESPGALASPLWGIWWGILLILILIFCGQSSKFIYIDF